jgi:arylsulfatase A-like enzyme
MLQEAGYTTGHVGKWHLGASTPYRPWKRGFTDTFSFLGGGHDYFEQADDENVANEYKLPAMRQGKIDSFKGYLTDALSAEACAFVRRHKDTPYFLYLAYNAPHTPLQVPENYLSRVSSINDETRRKYAAMVCAIDDGVGQLLAALRETNQEENTLIFFLSDNGGPSEGKGRNGSSNLPLRGAKGSVWEGGIRVPFVAQWKGKLPAGKTFASPVISLDITATAVALAGAKVPENVKLDGVNIIPHLTGQATDTPHDALYWRLGKRSAVRQGDWKLVLIEGAPSLFNLATDVSEQQDLAEKEPAKLKAMQSLYAAWDAQLATPRWGPMATK